MCGCAYVFPPSNGFLLPFVLRHAMVLRLDPSPLGALALRVFQRLLPSDVPKSANSVREKGTQFTQSTLALIKTALPPKSVYDVTLNDTLRLEALTEQVWSASPIKISLAHCCALPRAPPHTALRTSFLASARMLQAWPQEVGRF